MSEKSYPFPSSNSSYWLDRATCSYDEAVQLFEAQSDEDKKRMKNPTTVKKQAPKEEYPYPFPSRTSSHWVSNTTSFDEAVRMFNAQSPEDKKRKKNPVDSKSTIKHQAGRKAQQERHEAHQAENAPRQAESAQQQASLPKMNPENMYWPPYNPLAPEGEKEIEIEYTQDVLEIAILTSEEWTEFFTNLSHVITGKFTASGIKSAVDTAKELGGLGVEAYVKTYNGVEYLILKNYKKHLKTLLAGNRFKFSNPQIIQLGLGSLNSVKGLTRYMTVSAPVELLVGSALNGAQLLLNDEYTLRTLGVDQARLVVNTIATMGLALTVAAALPAYAVTVAGSGIILALSGAFVYGVDQVTGYSTDFVNFLAEQFE